MFQRTGPVSFSFTICKAPVDRECPDLVYGQTGAGAPVLSSIRILDSLLSGFSNTCYPDSPIPEPVDLDSRVPESDDPDSRIPEPVDPDARFPESDDPDSWIPEPDDPDA
jgi:hypothetical protein